MKDPKILLLDEPTSGLDEVDPKDLCQLLGELKQTRSIMKVSHESEEVASNVDSIFILNRGSLISHKLTSTLLQ